MCNFIEVKPSPRSQHLCILEYLAYMGRIHIWTHDRACAKRVLGSRRDDAEIKIQTLGTSYRRKRSSSAAKPDGNLPDCKTCREEVNRIRSDRRGRCGPLWEVYQ